MKQSFRDRSFSRPVLITGAAGFIGSHLTDHMLAAGAHVIAVDNFCDLYDPAVKRRNLQAAVGHERFTLIEADIRHRGALLAAFARYRPSTVVHLAAMAGVRASVERPDEYATVNVDGTVNTLDAAVTHGAERFIFASSSSVYGNNEKVPFAEDDPTDHPMSPYAATKKAGELLCHTYWHIHRLPTCCLRLFTVFGPRQRPGLAIQKFLRLIAEDRPIPVFGDGSSSRDYTFIDDIISGMRAAVDKCDGFRIYNLGSDHPVSLNQLIGTIERVAGRQVQIERLPTHPGDVSRTWADLSRSQAELGYQPAVPFVDGLARQWSWLKTTTQRD